MGRREGRGEEVDYIHVNRIAIYNGGDPTQRLVYSLYIFLPHSHVIDLWRGEATHAPAVVTAILPISMGPSYRPCT